MHDSENDFSPSLLDQQIEHPNTELPRGGARLVYDLQAMYKQNRNASIDRVWMQLAQHHADTKQPDKPLSLQTRKRPAQRSFRMQQIERTSTQRKSLPRFIALVAALLVSVVLIGGMLVFTQLMNQTLGTRTGAPPTATWNECNDESNPAEAALCVAHKETTLNITKTFGTHKVTFIRAYADKTQLMLVYIDGLATDDAISFMSVTIQQGIVLTGGGSNAYANPITHQGYNVASFPTSAVPAGTTELRIQSIVDGFSGKSTPLKITVPFHTDQKTVTVNQTATSKGISLSLKRVVFDGSSTLFYVGPEPYANGGYVSIHVESISLNGKPLDYSGGQRGMNADGTALVAISLDADLYEPGSWTIQIKGDQQEVGSASWTWTFHFTVPAN